jgi:four helix bundle protein
MQNEKVRTRRDIVERTFSFALRIVKRCRHIERTSGISRSLSLQLLRSGTSIGANVEEAQAVQSKADFVSKMAIALKEARETGYWLRLLKESDISDDGSLDLLTKEASELSNILGAIIAKTRKRSDS